MSQKVTIGGNRLGSGGKMETTLHGYSRSNHDLGHLWQSTISPGTLVPFLSLIALPGDTFDIDLDALIKTIPTVGPLFGSFKCQLDVFTAPIRLYHKDLHNNKLNVGLKMKEILFPRLEFTANNLTNNSERDPSLQQVGSSALLRYLGISGIAKENTGNDYCLGNFNAIPYLAYFDIFKNYYANKSEENAYIIHATKPTYENTEVNGDTTTFPFYLVIGTNLIVYGTSLTPDNI